MLCLPNIFLQQTQKTILTFTDMFHPLYIPYVLPSINLTVHLFFASHGDIRGSGITVSRFFKLGTR